MDKTYLGYNEKIKAHVHWVPDGKRLYKYLDGRIEVF